MEELVRAGVPRVAVDSRAAIVEELGRAEVPPVLQVEVDSCAGDVEVICCEIPAAIRKSSSSDPLFSLYRIPGLFGINSGGEVRLGLSVVLPFVLGGVRLGRVRVGERF